jgi:hypothetical protein
MTIQKAEQKIELLAAHSIEICKLEHRYRPEFCAFEYHPGYSKGLMVNK